METVRNPAFCWSVSHLEVIYGGTASSVCGRGGKDGQMLAMAVLPGSVELEDQKVSERSDFGTTFSEMPGIFQRESFSTNLEILLQ